MSVSRTFYITVVLNLFVIISSYASTDLYKVPFEYNNHGHIILNVNVNGDSKSLKFIFDTGGANLVNTGYKDYLNRETPEINSISIGNLTLSNLKFKKVNLSQKLGSDYVETLAGMIGPRLMQDFIWQIDYQKQMLYVTRTKEQLSFGKATYKIPFKPSHIFKAPMIKIETQEVGERDYVIDTGDPGIINDYKKALNKALKSGKKLESVSDTIITSWMRGYKIQSKGNTVKIIDARLGNMNLKETYIRFSDIAVVSIGNEFLENFIITIDWPARMIYLEPSNNCKLAVSAAPDNEDSH